MSVISIALPPGFQRAAEHVQRGARSYWHRGEVAKRRHLAEPIKPKSGLPLIDVRLGYALLPRGTINGVDAAVTFAQALWREQGFSTKRARKSDYRATILAPRTYEEAPPIFDLAFSEEVLSIAMDYLGEIPVLHNIELWATPTNEVLKGSQLYHLDGGKWFLRRAKFLFNMIDTNSSNGPFTFLPANISRKVADTNGRVSGRFKDDEVYHRASKSDEIALIGPAGTGAAVDSSRCLHFGSRAREGNRLLLMFHFLPIVDLVEGGDLRRTIGFQKRFGDHSIRNLIVPLKAKS